MKVLLIVVSSIYVLFLTTSSIASQQAILIGINDYSDEPKIARLRFASTDAQGLANILSQNGYQCRTLTDKEASKEMISEAFIQLEQRASQFGSPDVFIFYFSGRGTRISDDIQADEIIDNMDECILPSDAVAGNTLSYIKDDTLARWISAIKAKQTLIILDCSYAGNESRPEIKGFGELSKIGKLDAIDLADGLPENVIIIHASSPEGFAMDGVYTSILLEACSSEDADIDNDRRISFYEASKYAIDHLQGQQTPTLTNVDNFNIPLATLPALSRLQINSNPEGAKIIVHQNLLELPLDLKTPAVISLKKGKYGIQAQKVGFITSDIRQISIDEYDKVYIPDIIQLNPIKVIGRVNVLDNNNKAIPLGNKVLNVHVLSSDEVVCEERVSSDANFIFNPEKHSWLKVGNEYELNIIGQAVLMSEPVRFNYDGYSDIQVYVKANIDNIPPKFQEATFENNNLVLGEKTKCLIKADDEGTGLGDLIDIQLQSPDRQTIFSIPNADIVFDKPNNYMFQYTIPNDKSAVGKWKISSLTIKDKADNQITISADAINAGFMVFEDHRALGKYYFDNMDYENAITHFDQISPKDDDLLYMSALAYNYQDKPEQALAAFRSIKNPTEYLGNNRKEMPRMPRTMVNRLWGRLLKDLKDRKNDPEYIKLLVVTAEELGREYDAKIYREYAIRLQKK